MNAVEASVWSGWGPPLRVQVEASAIGVFAHALHDPNPVSFTYHRQPVAGDVLEGRMRVSEPMTKDGSRGRTEITYMDTEWRDPRGVPVVSERIISVFIPNA